MCRLQSFKDQWSGFTKPIVCGPFDSRTPRSPQPQLAPLSTGKLSTPSWHHHPNITNLNPLLPSFDSPANTLKISGFHEKRLYSKKQLTRFDVSSPISHLFWTTNGVGRMKGGDLMSGKKQAYLAEWPQIKNDQ
jgi:hypothetical protein